MALSAQKLVPAAYGGNAPSEDACLITASDARNAHPYFFRKSMGFFMLSLQGAGGAQSCGLSPAVRSVRLSMAALPGHKGADRGTLLSSHGSAGGAERQSVDIGAARGYRRCGWARPLGRPFLLAPASCGAANCAEAEAQGRGELTTSLVEVSECK